MMSKARLARFQKQLTPQTAALISKPTDIAYLSGFHFLIPEEREAFLLITAKKAHLFHHSFSPIPKSAFCQTHAGISHDNLSKYLTQIKQAENLQTLFADQDNLVVSEWQLLLKQGLKLEALPKEWLAEQRMSKDEEEIALMRAAGRISLQAFKKIKRTLRPGQTELEVAEKLDQILKKLGSQQLAFPTIVAFGDHTALPHHQPTNRPLQVNQAVLIDFGGSVKGYKADMTRSWWYGKKVEPEYQTILRLVQESYALGVKTLKKTVVTANQIDQAVRTHINQARYGQYYIHTTGHGVGLDIHEAPSLYLTNQQPLPQNCAITIEPGIYLPGKYGVRYENTLIYQKLGPEALTSDSQLG